MKRYLPIGLLFVCVMALVFGILQLFELRYEVGDVYPEYSSLRSDPLGTMVLYESLERVTGLTPKRDFSTANRLPDAQQTAYFHLATPLDALRRLPEETFSEIERFVTTGGRFVITMFPRSSVSDPPRNDEQTAAEVDARKRVITVRDRWGLDFQIINLKGDVSSSYEPEIVNNESGLPLPEALEWHSGIVFADLNPAWKPIYTRGANAVVIERKFGRGHIVIATDSYFLSNEAMLKDRQARFLAWLIGPSETVIFDEAHLGVTERPGIATLIRKYRLYWFAAGLLTLAGLLIWKNSMSLLPPHAAGKTELYVAGKDAAAGFDNLLRRSIPARDLLGVCFTEWKQSAAHAGKYSAARIQQAEAAFNLENTREAKDRDPLRVYQTISKILQTKIK